MKRFSGILAVLAVLTIGAFAQAVPPAPPVAPSNIYAAGVSFNSGASTAVAGTGMYAHLLSDGTGTYAFTVVDVLPNTFKPFTVTTDFSAGIAQKIVTLGKVPIYIPTSAGVSFTGSNTGWAWSTGAMASIKVKGGFHVFPNVRIVKSSVSGGTGYQPVVGLLFGWEQ